MKKAGAFHDGVDGVFPFLKYKPAAMGGYVYYVQPVHNRQWVFKLAVYIISNYHYAYYPHYSYMCKTFNTVL